MKKTPLPVLLLLCILSCITSDKKKTVTEAPEITPTGQKDRDTDATLRDPEINIQGIDISHHQGTINWDTLKTAGITFIFIKSTGGLDYTDPKFHENWANAKKAGFLRGAYHFYYSADDPEQQARFFKNTVLPVSDSLDLPPVLDIETHGVNSDISISQYQQDVKKWLASVEAAFSKRPIIYTSKNFANKYLKDTVLGSYHLWLAEYGVENPTVPETWKNVGWTLWQNTYLDTVPWIEGNVDHNIFTGSVKALRRLGD